ncbi:cold-regulated 413 plasma membrane protein 4-like isoform X2 [Hibiscus syriacus]|uniref:cold-regulated 413 plasma membrane protein 4-like isoform X2 n=1 Tax=Hibiscus syriacus TaxID=106335 RepID=UPI0019230613|nr:cold-regulated 413 plasma membrane protein 4-like isoform X2 [Hibiscus syriacus]
MGWHHFGLILLLMNRTGRRSHMLTNLLVLFLFASFPTILFKLVRGQFGCWVAFLAVALNLYFPETFPVPRFVLFVIAPDWLAHRLRDDKVPGIICLVITALIILTEIRGAGVLEDSRCSCYCLSYWFSIACLLCFTILYLAA